MPDYRSRPQVTQSAGVLSRPRAAEEGRRAMAAPAWDPGQDWILVFDRLLKHPQGPGRGCRCDICEIEADTGEDSVWYYSRPYTIPYSAECPSCLSSGVLTSELRMF